MKEWKFQKIQDIKDSVLNHDVKNLKEYNKALCDNIEPKLYVEYLVWHFDINVDLDMVKVCAQNVYQNLCDDDIERWVCNCVGENQIIV